MLENFNINLIKFKIFLENTKTFREGFKYLRNFLIRFSLFPLVKLDVFPLVKLILIEKSISRNPSDGALYCSHPTKWFGHVSSPVFY